MDHLVEKEISIGVVTHKPYAMPRDKAYLPLWVGPKHDEPDGFVSHAEGDEIANRNESYCELTGLYWLWKNVKANYKGLVHYRRILARRSTRNIQCVLSTEDYRKAFKDVDVLLPPRKWYPFSTLAKHYCSSKKGYEDIHRDDIAAFLKAIWMVHPSASLSAETILNSSRAHMLNIFCMHGRMFDEYCEWLFPVLECFVDLRKKRMDKRRYVGAISEFAIDIWLAATGASYREFGLYEPEASSVDRLAKIILSSPRHGTYSCNS